LNKNPTKFWKSWNAKFKRNINKSVSFDGSQDDTDAANKFVTYFGEIYKSNSNSHDKIPDNKLSSDDACHKIQQLPCDILNRITVELVDNCIEKLSLKKACGPDDLSAEHLLHL